jgi:hypothetical protein
MYLRFHFQIKARKPSEAPPPKQEQTEVTRTFLSALPLCRGPERARYNSSPWPAGFPIRVFRARRSRRLSEFRGLALLAVVPLCASSWPRFSSA